MTEDSDTGRPHLTTRRGFITAAGFGVVSLYGLWAAYGAAPLGWLAGHADGPSDGAGHGGGHGGAGVGMSPEEFRRLAEQFIEQNQLSDGSVQPRRTASLIIEPDAATRRAALRDPAAGNAEHTLHVEHGSQDAGPAIHDDHAAQDPGHALHEDHAAQDPGHAMHEDHGADDEHAAQRAHEDDADHEEPIDVYLMVFKWGYAPGVLRLEAGVPYRFRMMALDSSHGASIQMGKASRMIRLPAKALVEMELRFTEPGEHLLYCTVYCGVAHDRMYGRIVVT
jgi:cytochrome c oxidase subunit II